MASLPKVSVIVTNYNYAQYIEEALDSIVNQIYDSFEAIVVDDCSTDQSVSIIESYTKKYPFIKLVTHTTNQGLHAAISTGLAVSRGEYIMTFSTDDILLPEFLKKQADILDQFPDVGLCCSKHVGFVEDPNVPREYKPLQQEYYFTKMSPRDFLYQCKMYRFTIAGNTTMVRKKYFLEVGGFAPEHGAFTDWFAYHQIGFLYGVYYLPETLTLMRLHSFAMSRTQNLEGKMKNWDAIITSLKKNKKLKKFFIRSHCFKTFGLPFYNYILKSPKHWLFFKQYTYRHYLQFKKKEKHLTAR